MTREGAVEVNAATGKKKRISKRIRDADFAKTEAPQPPEQAAQTIPGGAACQAQIVNKMFGMIVNTLRSENFP